MPAGCRLVSISTASKPVISDRRRRCCSSSNQRLERYGHSKQGGQWVRHLLAGHPVLLCRQKESRRQSAKVHSSAFQMETIMKKAARSVLWILACLPLNAISQERTQDELKKGLNFIETRVYSIQEDARI